ncbi:MAG: thiolase family protein [Deltaproteobacteria bacterium]|nr:thiolase family protein [Deltaproteobacteria bacterium]MBW2052188.1 thiolase family protein [Deltaproteobacteria bacterium]MBW2141391.1 thiolase family protein [Deltaproteobacteria bacterium]
MKFRNAVIVDGVRSPFARGGRGKLEATRLDDIGAILIRTLFERNPQVKPNMVEDFGIGTGGDSPEITMLNNISRLAGLPHEVPNFLSNRHCASSMETLHRVSMAIMLGEYDCAIAIGAERMTRVMGGGRGAGPKRTRLNSLPNPAYKNSKEQRDLAHDHFEYFSTPIPDFVLDSPPYASMVQTAQNVVEMYDLSREELDAFAMKSQHRLHEANEQGLYKDEVIALEVEDPVFDENGVWVEEEKGPKIIFDRDESIRPGTSMEGLAKLNPVKGIVSYGGNDLKITAGNSCPTNTGVSVILVMSEEKALKLGLDPLARIIGWGNAGVKQQIMGMGPVPATKKALKHAGLTADQIDLVEFNEAFAAQVIPSLRELGIPEEKCNVNGGSIGIGHPIGATGCRIVMTVAHELRRSGKRYALATQCIGAGQGATTVLEGLHHSA